MAPYLSKQGIAYSMTDEKQIVLLTEVEARTTLTKIKESIANTRILVVDFYEREGWKSLHYDSFESCINVEFGKSVSYVYRQLWAGLTEKRLPIGEIGDNRESHLRKLSVILGDNDDQIERAWIMAMSISENPTAETFDHAAKLIWVNDHCVLPVVKERMANGYITPSSAYTISKSLDGKPYDLTNVCQEVQDPAMLPMLYRIYHEDSETWQEIALTKHIPSVDEQIPIGEASPQNLRAWLVVSSNEHRAVAIEENRARFNHIRECTEAVISEARHVAEKYPELSTAIEEYDSAIRR